MAGGLERGLGREEGIKMRRHWAGITKGDSSTHRAPSSATTTTTSWMAGGGGQRSVRLFLLLLAALLALQPCGAPPINPGQDDELKLPIVRDTVKVCKSTCGECLLDHTYTLA